MLPSGQLVATMKSEYSQYDQSCMQKLIQCRDVDGRDFQSRGIPVPMRMGFSFPWESRVNENINMPKNVNVNGKTTDNSVNG